MRAWFDHPGLCFLKKHQTSSYDYSESDLSCGGENLPQLPAQFSEWPKEVQFKMFCLPLKTIYTPAKKVNEIPDYWALNWFILICNILSL